MGDVLSIGMMIDSVWSVLKKRQINVILTAGLI